MFPLKDTQPSYTRPVVTLALIAVNLLVFVFEYSLGSPTLNAFIEYYGLVPDHFQVSRVFTSMFLHGGWLHVLLNMWFLWIFGDNIEDLLGHAKYLVFYLLCGAVAGLGQVIANPYSTVPMVGASGAIAGVMGAYLIKFPRARILTLVFVVFFITTIEIPAPIMLVYWFVTQLFSGFGSIAQTHISQGGTAFFAHIGGFVAGIVLVKLMGATGQYNRRRDRYWE
ncbi:MAG TPA: rhomboid family intramembrane serine protease [Bryobacteraceae bacterium]|jgi:membrane associated rhomboid family serine protease|nr:rhomboid family intramembrane serine protease [Bryobacteraceae bacterium]